MGWIQAYRREGESHNKILRGSTIAFLIIFEHKKIKYLIMSNYSKINHRCRVGG